MGVDEVAASGVTGKGVTIAVIDGLINTQVPELADADLHVHEPSFCKGPDGGPLLADTTIASFDSLHGTDVVTMIAGNGHGINGVGATGVAPDATVLFYSDSDGNGSSSKLSCTLQTGSARALSSAIVQAVDDGANIISVSQHGVLGQEGLEAVAWALHEGLIIVVSVPNNGDGATGLLVNGVVPVGSIDSDTDPVLYAGVPPIVRAPGVDMLIYDTSFDAMAQGSGNSFATPIVAGVLADVWSKYPDATGNQILQSLIHNTGPDDHDLSWDDTFGYGVVGLRHMLAVDPTGYEDVNPLVENSPYGDELSVQDIAEATRPSWAPPVQGVPAGPPVSSPAPSSSSSVAPAPAPGGGSVWVWVLAAAGVAVVVLVVVVVRAARRS
jgi:subtilisin family serine protease